MRRFTQTVVTVAFLVSVAISISGCGKKDENTVPTNSVGGPVIYNSAGAAVIGFTAQNIYVSTSLISVGSMRKSCPNTIGDPNYCIDLGYGAWDFQNNQRSGGSGSVAITGVNTGQGGIVTLSGVSGKDPGTSVMMVLQPGPDSFHYNVVAGTLTVSAQWIQRVYGGGLPPVTGLTLDLGLNGTTLGLGGIIIYTVQDFSFLFF